MMTCRRQEAELEVPRKNALAKKTFGCHSVPPFSDLKNTTGLHLAVGREPRQRRGACSAFITETRFNSFPNERSLCLHSRGGGSVGGGGGGGFLSAVADRSAVELLCSSSVSALRPFSEAPRRAAATINNVRAPLGSRLQLNDNSFIPTKHGM